MRQTKREWKSKYNRNLKRKKIVKIRRKNLRIRKRFLNIGNQNLDKAWNRSKIKSYSEKAVKNQDFTNRWGQANWFLKSEKEMIKNQNEKAQKSKFKKAR